MAKYRLFDIQYDIDEEGDDEGLPSELVVEIDIDEDVEYNGADKISDVTGFCVISFRYEMVV